MVVAPKPNGSERMYVDLMKLNENVMRKRHTMPSVEQTLAQLNEAKLFLKLDANSGFWQIPLCKQSTLLTTFITPFGRYCFNRMPLGITSAPEHFQHRMSEILQGLDGVVCLMDDILVHGKTEQEHDQNLISVLGWIQSAGVTLNEEKSLFGKKLIKFLGQLQILTKKDQ